jgi:short-subunit dehydrogenase involved in D-alanine esterification of teichoic acids
MQINSKAFLEELKATGCNIMVSNCDVAVTEELNAVLEKCKEAMPPIRGVVQGAMVLQVRAVLSTCIRPMILTAG